MRTTIKMIMDFEKISKNASFIILKYRYRSGYILFLVFFLFAGCKRNESRWDEIAVGGITIIHLDSLEEKDLVTYPVRLEYLRKIEVGGSVFEVADKWPDSVEIVKLETAQECLMGVVKRIYVVDSLLFISDSNEKLFVFDRSGKFRNTIGTLGRGNDELLSMVDFCVDA